MLQYIGPSLQFVIAVVVEHEPMSPARWLGFGLIWVALCMVTVEARMRHTQRNRALRTGPMTRRTCLNGLATTLIP